MPMTTALEVPGMRIRESIGICYGLVVRSMGVVGGVTASFKALRRGEISEYTQLLEDSRRHAIDRMVDNARLLGADAMISLALSQSVIAMLSEEVRLGLAAELRSVLPDVTYRLPVRDEIHPVLPRAALPRVSALLAFPVDAVLEALRRVVVPGDDAHLVERALAEGDCLVRRVGPVLVIDHAGQ